MIFIFFFFFNDTATTEIYTLSLHDALPILSGLDNLSADRPLVEGLDALLGNRVEGSGQIGIEIGRAHV